MGYIKGLNTMVIQFFNSHNISYIWLTCYCHINCVVAWYFDNNLVLMCTVFVCLIKYYITCR